MSDRINRDEYDTFEGYVDALEDRIEELELKLELWNQEAVEHELIARLRVAKAQVDRVTKLPEKWREDACVALSQHGHESADCVNECADELQQALQRQ